MKPKNSKERRNNILKFALLFVVTTALIVTAFFFDFDRVPLKENTVLRERSASIEQEMQFQEKFSKDMHQVKALIDSLDVPGQNYSYINQLINTKIIELQKSLPAEDTTYRYDMYANIVNSYLEMKEMKGKLNNYKEVDQTLKDYKEELQRLKDELNIANRNLDAYRLSN